MSNYPTNLTEKQWQVIKNIVEPQERNRKSSLREIVNGIFYVNKSGCQWRMLPLRLERTFSWLENYSSIWRYTPLLFYDLWR